MKYAIAAGSLSPSIYVGRVSKTAHSFADKEEATDMAIHAVAEYVKSHFGGHMSTTYPKAGFMVTVKVTPLSPADPGRLAQPHDRGGEFDDVEG